MVVSLDLETTSLSPYTGDILLLSYKAGDKHEVISSNIKEKLIELLQPENIVIAHNASFDASFIYHKYGLMHYNWFDTYIASKMISNGFNFSHKLYDVIYRFLNIKIDIDKVLMQRSFINNRFISEDQIAYALKDTEHLEELMYAQKKVLDEMRLTTAFKLEMKLLPVLVSMMVNGVKIDKENWNKQIVQWETKANQLVEQMDNELYKITQKKIVRYKKIKTLFGEEIEENPDAINYASSSQIDELFKQFNIFLDSTDKINLVNFINTNKSHPLVTFTKLLLEYREITKLLTTYGKAFLEQLDSNSKIHTSFNQVGTDTGRLSSSNPNLQNIPPAVKPFFIADKGNVLVTVDMAAAEVRLAADYSDEPTIKNSLINGTDMHSYIATDTFSIIFKRPVEIRNTNEKIVIDGHEFVLSELRDAHKPVTFSKFYLCGAKRILSLLMKYINLFHEPDNYLNVANEISKAIDNKLPKLIEYLKSKVKEATTPKQLGYEEVLRLYGTNSFNYLRSPKIGRIRFFESTAYGEAANFMIQAANAEAIKIAMVNAYNRFKELGYGKLILTVHDEIVAEVPEDKGEEAFQELKTIVANALQFMMNSIPGKADGTVSKSWKKK